jgi:hypothetical protein
VPAAVSVPHVYVGQQVVGSVPVCLAHLHVGAAQAVPEPDAPGIEAVVDRTHIGQ